MKLFRNLPNLTFFISSDFHKINWRIQRWKCYSDKVSRVHGWVTGRHLVIGCTGFLINLSRQCIITWNWRYIYQFHSRDINVKPKRKSKSVQPTGLPRDLSLMQIVLPWSQSNSFPSVSFCLNLKTWEQEIASQHQDLYCRCLFHFQGGAFSVMGSNCNTRILYSNSKMS